ncbi:actin-related protein 5 [Zostera marina]|uniref:Actin-related protein 5 n=1 Tax=Zostera marina TaxID=29655 RepID=A0A0K9NRJ2_ZOSMR|nr:actin-related protein 5 [Zostera marina]
MVWGPAAIRPQRQTDYRFFPSTTPIVIDNGSSHFRIGWAGESDPRITFRNIVQRPRHRSTGETVTMVGDQDPALMKYFDCTRSSCRSPFDSNVVYQFDTMEYILDYGFERLGVDGSEVDHPILMTECVYNPVSSRCRMSELLFETYGVPSIAFGVDSAFSYKYNQHHGFCNEDGFTICTGLSASHVIPFVSGEPVFGACCRTNVGGYNITEYLRQLLSLKYPYHMSNITFEKSEDLKTEHCYVALNYAEELQLFQDGTRKAEEKYRYWQLPWIPPPQEEMPSEEEIARKAALREKQGQRLREMAAAKKISKIAELEKELNGLDFLLRQLENVEEGDIPSFLSDTKYHSKQEVASAVGKVSQILRKAKGEPAEVEDSYEPSLEEKYPLINIPDNMLTPDQLKEKKKQIFMKTTTEGRLRAKQRHIDEKLQRDRENEQEEEKRIENPELYLEKLHAKYKEISEKLGQRKRMKLNGNGGNGNNNTPGSVGRGERLNAAQKERMRLLTTAAYDRGKGEDTFGAKDEDWQLYKLMSKDNDDDERDLDEAELSRITLRLQTIDPNFAAISDALSTDPPRFQPHTADDFKIVLGVERFRCPEILFQPCMVGFSQAGLDEMIGVSLRRLDTKNTDLKDRICNSILVTGGGCLFPGICPRLEVGIRPQLRFLSPLKVTLASNPTLDAWRGAALCAASSQFHIQTFTKHDYYEKGEDWVRQYQFKYDLATSEPV